MTRYYDVEEDYTRSRSQRPRDPSPLPRDHSPEYYSGGGVPRVYEPGPYASGAIPPYGSDSRLPHESQRPLSPRDNMMSLQIPTSRHRPRSQPPPSNAVITRRRSRSRSRSSSRSSSDRDGKRPRTPLGKAQHVLKDTFSPSTSGIGVGLLGAVVGGLAAREASDATVRVRNKREHANGTYHPRPEKEKEHDKSRLISTVVGALVGGLGANAIEKRIEHAREKNKDRQDAWEKRWGKEEDLPHYDTGNPHERDHGRGRPRGRRDSDKDEDDYVYEERRTMRMRSEDPHRYRN